MAPESSTDTDDISERVARGFEALVDEEPLPVAPVPSSLAAKQPAAEPPPPPPPGDTAFDRSRLDAIEDNARHTMQTLAALDARVRTALDRIGGLDTRVRTGVDRLAELIDGQGPDSLETLRSEIETLRREVSSSIASSSESLAEERKELRAQIATTVGAANRWFVRTRDELYARLEELSRLAEKGMGAAPQGAPQPAPAPAGGERDEAAGGAELEWEVEAPPAQEAGSRLPAVVPSSALAPVRPVAAGREDGGALAESLRGDVQELQVEVAAMGEAVLAVREELEKLRQRMPSRSRTVKLDETQIELIVEAVITALPKAPRAAAPRKKAAPAASPAPARRTRS